MIKDVQVGIQNPCSENWSQMSPEADGRFCASCQKKVHDFTMMGDQEILQWFARHQGSACGRFRPDQLNRPMVSPPEKKSRWRYWHYLIAGLLFSSEVSAQTKPAGVPMSQHIYPAPDTRTLMGDTILVTEGQPTPDLIRGRVMDENGRPVVYATIMYSKAHGTVTDNSGNFSIPVNKVSQQATLYITALGYKSDSVAVKQFLAVDQTHLIVLKTEANVLGEVVVIPEKIITKRAADTISIFKDTLAAIGLGKSALSVYPNPVAKGSSVTVSAKLDQTGTYTIQLYSISGTIMQTTQVNGAPKTPTFSINIPGNLTPGTYIVRLSHPALTKCYSQEIVVF
jgi:hypothetical protein